MPPAMPPRKKYQTMYHSHCGAVTKCSIIALLLAAALAEREDGADDTQHGRDQCPEVAARVVPARQHGALGRGQPVDFRLVGQEEERVQPAVFLLAVEPRLRHPLPAQLVQARAGDLLHRAEIAELDRLGRARFGAGRHQVGLQPVVAERALASQAARVVEADDVVRAGRDAVAAAVAHAGLDVDGVELGPDDRVRRAHFHAARLRAVLADVAHHVPGHAALGGAALVELDVTPVLLVELPRVVVAVAELGRVPGKLVPLLARDLAGLAADAERRVGEEADRSRHCGSPIRSPSDWARPSRSRAPGRTGRAAARRARRLPAGPWPLCEDRS